ncbi:UDP-GlcNAc:betaGal beta-1,3-N-acetylglucosaminyltransferase 7 [Macrotis lagotis]|uniref:UDP-GlcNAc:betaGal beta-1,3-N-acetylglucosaminyltransferase 7 n=1 Tax=Macrotis lagotis TaxID=92651 RepID=UPI003D6825A0
MADPRGGGGSPASPGEAASAPQLLGGLPRALAQGRKPLGSPACALCPPAVPSMGQWKKTIYRSVCLSLVVLVALTVLQRGLTPSQFFDPSQAHTEQGKAGKLPGGLSDSIGFWRIPRKAKIPAPHADDETPVWDVRVSNCSANANLSREAWFRGLEPHFQRFLLYRHCRYFPILMNHPEKCAGEVYLLVVVKSIITQHDRREAIRRTWGLERPAQGGRGAVRTLFLLGTASQEAERAHYQQLLAYEDRLYGDILQWDFLDTFFNLTLKEVHFLKWQATFCPRVRFIFKGDDDVFVSPDNLLEYLADRRPEEDLFVGDVLSRARPIRRKDNKYYIPGPLYSKPFYPPYAGGGGFLMAGGLARRLFHASESLELYPIDDVFLGMCLQALGVRPTAHVGFKTFGIMRNKSSPMNKEPCFFRSMLVVHKLLPPELLDMWELVHGNLTCSRKLQVL